MHEHTNSTVTLRSSNFVPSATSHSYSRILCRDLSTILMHATNIASQIPEACMPLGDEMHVRDDLVHDKTGVENSFTLKLVST